MPGIQMSVTGLKQLTDKLRSNMPKARQAVKAELYQFSEEVMTDSLEVVPWLTGTLAGTGKVQSPVEDGNVITVTMGYGDEAIGYALYVHEEMNSPSGNAINWTRPGSGPKFLSTPLQAKQDQLPGRLKTVLMSALKS
jgi:hypothetical protein